MSTPDTVCDTLAAYCRQAMPDARDRAFSYNPRLRTTVMHCSVDRLLTVVCDVINAHPDLIEDAAAELAAPRSHGGLGPDEALAWALADTPHLQSREPCLRVRAIAYYLATDLITDWFLLWHEPPADPSAIETAGGAA